MLFNSLQFLFFFVIVTILFYRLPHKNRWLLLLLASCYFYMVFLPIYIFILGFTIVVDYFAGLYIERSSGNKKKLLLTASIIANTGVLAFFKYWNFLNDNLTQLLQQLHVGNPVSYLSIILPIGLSFHTFQAMSYTIEVYRGKQKAEKHFGIYSLYVMFYPQLVAGPIERPQNVLPQFHREITWDFEKVKAGLMLMAFGFFKKVVIADRLALVADYSFNNVEQTNGLSMIMGVLFFTFQIYCDFSGYSDIALGCAGVMGYKLMENFRTPYFSASISEFWRRWHISLSTWFRDYLYIPLGGNRVKLPRMYVNILIVFMVSGLWHGANWTFVAWGFLHGLYLVLAQVRDHFFPRLTLPVAINVIITFILAAFAWIFFRADTITEAFAVIKKITGASMHDTWQSPLNNAELVLCFILIIILLCKEKWMYEIPVKSNMGFYSMMILLIGIIYFFGIFNLNQFIYFQF